MTTPRRHDQETPHLFSELDTGAINPGWPVDVNAVVPGFTSSVQGERAALSIVGNILYVPYGGHAGDCGTYHGWLVGIQINDPTIVMAWATDAIGGGAGPREALPAMEPICSWRPGTLSTPAVTGAAVKQSFVFNRARSLPEIPATTGRLLIGSISTRRCRSGRLGSIAGGRSRRNTFQLVVALGKDGNAYLLNRDNLGGITRRWLP